MIFFNKLISGTTRTQKLDIWKTWINDGKMIGGNKSTDGGVMGLDCNGGFVESNQVYKFFISWGVECCDS